MMQFQNQLQAVDMPTPRERIGSGKHSPITTQPVGPQVVAKKKMLRQMKAIMARTAAGSSASTRPAVVPTMATMYCMITMPKAP